MKRIKLIHKEENSDCMEILKDTIVEDRELMKYKIDKNTLLQNLPEGVVNSFLDFLTGFTRVEREMTLKMIKNGTLELECTEELGYGKITKGNKPNYPDRKGEIPGSYSAPRMIAIAINYFSNSAPSFNA